MPTPSEAAPARRRRWPRRLLIGLNIVVAVCVFATGSLYAYVTWRFGQIDKVDLSSVLHGRLAPAGGASADSGPTNDMNVLVVGSDTRQLSQQGEFGGTRNVQGARSDTIMVLHIEPGVQKASILSIPRDLYVPIAGKTTKSGRPLRGRINESFSFGPDALIATIQDNLGIALDHYVEVDFDSFRSIVKTVGGVTVYFPAPARDRFSDLNIPTAGCVKLDPNQALSYVRARHFQYKENGRWKSDPTSDLGRINRQQDFIRRMMAKAIRTAPTRPDKANALVSAAVKNLTVDKGLSVTDIARLGWKFRSLSPDKVEMLTLPTEPTMVGAAEVEKLKQPEAAAVLAQFTGQDRQGGGALDASEVPAIPPSSVRVRVLNGSGVGGQATEVSRSLQSARFIVTGTGNAASLGQPRTTITYGPGQLDKAKLLRAYLDGETVLREDATLRSTDVVLTTGTSYRGVRAPGAAVTTTTTAAPATTTTGAPAKGAPGDTAPAQPQC